MDKILKVKNLKTSFFTEDGEVEAVRGINFEVSKGEILGIVGESGSGKSITSKSIMRIIQKPGKIISGELLFNDEDLMKKSDKEMRKVRGNEISMVFQDSMTALNPLLTVGKQIGEIITRHQGLNKKEAREKSIEMLKKVGIPSPETRIDNYPHEFSGGMRQRVCIAMAISSNPKLLIADEPTTALDVTIQAQILRLLKELNVTTGSSVMLITHDLGVVYNTCDRVIVMYGGRIMEDGTVKEIFENPKHPYTKGLLKSIPKARCNKKERLVPIDGTPPNLLNPPSGCPFFDRCEYKIEKCSTKPSTTLININHKVDCWIY
ncbi:MAG: ABC transporter ATP-binding protein [Paraclostridium sp.]|uniref:ABC transporter ATP-binding protein n=1 Tax=Paraclostridium sp. TaxID=2023273 RepID=UPI003F374EB3